MEEGDIGLTTLESSPQSIRSTTSDHQLVAERPPNGTHILVPTKYPLVIRALSQKDQGTEWVVIKTPVERVGVGIDVIAVSEGDEFWIGPVVMAGEVERVVRFERKYVVYEVRGLTGQEWELGVKYSDSTVGAWRRVWEFCFNFNDQHGEVEGYGGVRGVLSYLWGSCCRM